jgi:hypothetical protein
MRSFVITGEPALWLTAREAPWKKQVSATLGPVILAPQSVHMQFAVREWTRRGNHFDVDNLATPVLNSIFGASAAKDTRSSLMRWRATVRQSPSPFLLLDLFDDPGEAITRSQHHLVLDGTWLGALPIDSRAKSFGFPEWIRDHIGEFKGSPADRFGVSLVFGDVVRDISRPEQKPIKPAIDCLYPLFGGTAANGDDWKVQILEVERRPSLQETCHVQCWRLT